VLQQRLDAHETAARLLAQADALDERVRALRRQASDLSYDAMDLRTEAERLTREPVSVRHRPETHEGFQRRVLDVLSDAGALSISDLADHLNASHTRLRQALATLDEAGLVRRTGIKRGTRYMAVSDDADDAGVPDNVREFQTYETKVRDAAVELDTFEFVDLQRALPDLSEGTIRRWLRRLEDRGIVQSERVGVAKVYAYVPPTNNAPSSRPRKPTPEREATRHAPDMFAGSRRGDAVAGTRNTRVGSGIVNALIREVRAVAPDVTIKRTAHKVAFMRDGVEIAHCSSTPGASSLKKSRSLLRKAGVDVGG
jgi:DNA-binding transcriptional ArsR family regulator